MRAFIGISLPQEIILRLSSLQEILKETNVKAAWVKPANLHITLKFLGEIGPGQLNAARIALKNTARHFNCFTATLTGLGVFPDTRSPRIIWVGVGQENGRIAQLAAAIETGIKVPEETRNNHDFLTHITIARVKSKTNLKALSGNISALSKYYADAPVVFKIDKLALFESKLTAGGSIYEKVAQEDLKIS
jgi:2'-5' RNA ligase